MPDVLADVVGQTMHDADAHVRETASWVRSYADPLVRERMEASALDDVIVTDGPLDRIADDPGFESRLVFTTHHDSYLLDLEQRERPDLELVYGAARAHNRAMLDWCRHDGRLLPTGYLPLVDVAATVELCTEAIEAGAAALLIASRCPRGHSPSHVGLEPVWAQAEEAGIPVVFHAGGGGELLSASYFRTGRSWPGDGMGGDERARSVSSMAVAGPPMQTLATLILDGVLERFPELRFGVIEQGAAWLPSWMQQMESAMNAFGRHEERLRQLTLRPSDYVRRQVRVTPTTSEDVGWLIDQVGADVCLFASDHEEDAGDRPSADPFERWLGDHSHATRQQFYCENFVDLLGAAMPAFV
jgi:uncharacterized protein